MSSSIYAATSSPSQSSQKLESVFGGTVLHKYARSKDWTKLLTSCRSSTYAGLLRTLNEHQRTPLHYAIESGAPEDVILELIRLAPFQVRVRDLSGETPLHLGCQFGIPLIVVYALLEADATTAKGSPSVLTLRNDDDMTPLDILQLPQETAHQINQTLSWVAQQASRLFSTSSSQPPSPETSVIEEPDLTGVNWQYHRDQADLVLRALEEAASGKTGYVDMAF